MAEIETSDPTTRGHKRQKPGNPGSDTPAPENSRKRPRLEQQQSFLGKIRTDIGSFVSGLWGYFVGHPKEMDHNSTADPDIDEEIR